MSSLANAQEACREEILTVRDMYARLESVGSYGPQFQNLKQVWRNSSGSLLLARLQVPPSLKIERYHMHPAVLDAVFHMAGFVSKVFRI